MAWFALWTYERISFFVSRGFPLGIDARIYHRGVDAWLSGGDPWATAVIAGGESFNYAGTPVTTVLMAPAALLSEDMFTAVWLIATWVAAIWTLRALKLPIWWLLFPPLSEGLFSANPQVVVLALLLANQSALSAVATALKVYAFVPLAGEGRWRQIGWAVVLNALTIAVAPSLWVVYLQRVGDVARRIEIQSVQGFSAYYFPNLLPIVAGALLLLAFRDRRAAGWLAVPALWPASQFHYSTMALPVMSPLLAIGLSVPILRLPPIVIVVEAGRRLVESRMHRSVRDDGSKNGE